MVPLHDFALLLPGGGASTRFGTGNKLLCLLDGMPVFLHCVKNLAHLFPTGNIFLAVPQSMIETFRAEAAKYLPTVTLNIIAGGSTRAESVRNLANAAAQTSCRYIAIHDAARPFISADAVLECAAVCRESSAALLCHRITDTVKFSEDGLSVGKTVPRASLWGAETPQMFDIGVYLAALAMAENSDVVFTDDAQIVEMFSDTKVRIVENLTRNDKITYAKDLPPA